MITLEECLERNNISFKGICVQDARNNDKVKLLGITLGWVLNSNKAEKYKKILISGNDKTGNEHWMTGCNDKGHKKERRYFFIADIVDIVHLNTLLRKTNGMADETIRKHHCGAEFPIKLPSPNWGENRYAIYFENPSETYKSDTDYKLWESSVKYIY